MALATGKGPEKRARFTEEYMVAILRDADKTSVAEIARKHKIREQTIHNRRRHFGALEPADIKHLPGLETESASSPNAPWAGHLRKKLFRLAPRRRIILVLRNPS